MRVPSVTFFVKGPSGMRPATLWLLLLLVVLAVLLLLLLLLLRLGWSSMHAGTPGKRATQANLSNPWVGGAEFADGRSRCRGRWWYYWGRWSRHRRPRCHC